MDEANTTDSEISGWVQLDDNARDKKRFEKKGPQKEIEVTQEMRRKHFDNWETTDDHGVVIEGIATDQEGNRYYKVKNSWDTNRSTRDTSTCRCLTSSTRPSPSRSTRTGS